MKRLSIFFFYDSKGIVDDYVVYFLAELKKVSSDIFFVVNGNLSDVGRKKVLPYTMDILIRENKGFDVWAYKEGIECVGYEVIAQYDELIMLNHTNFGPIFDLGEMFDTMEARTDLDFWGITKSLGNNQDIPPHIQSHFIAVRSRMLRSEAFKEYWENCPRIRCFEDALYKHEFVFTKHFQDLNFLWDVYLNIDEFQDNIANPLLTYPLYCVENKRCPIIKRKSFFLQDDWLYESKLAGRIPELMDYLQRETSYNTDMIWQNLLRTQSMRTLVKTMRLYYIQGQKEISSVAGKSALCIDLVAVDALAQIANNLLRVASNMDIYLYCKNDDCYAAAKECFSAWTGSVVLVNKENDLSALWQENLALLQYDSVCFVSTEHVQSDLTDSFRIYAIEHFDNMLSQSEQISESVHLFQQKKRLGMIVSGVRRQDMHFVWTWKIFGSRFLEFCQKAGINVPVNGNEVPAFYNTDFCWVRPAVLPLLWEHASALAQSELETGFQRCFAVAVLQSAGYYTMYYLSHKAAEDGLNLDDYNEEKWLVEDYCLRSNQRQSISEKVWGSIPLWKRVLNRFPRFKAFLKQLYYALKHRDTSHVAINQVSHNTDDHKSSEMVLSSNETVDTIDVIWERETFSKKPNAVVDPEHLDIAFLVPKPIKGGGGHRNIYRAVRFLSEYGHHITVYHADCQDELGSVTKEHVCQWFYPLKEDVRFISYKGQIGACDVCIACWWELAYELKKNLVKIKFPFYMVQDYEAAFYPMSASALLAENTYKMGFSHICSGRWCKEFLEAKYNAEAAYFTFPVDHQTYNMSLPRTKKNKNIVFFAKPEMPRRCYELGIRALAIVKERRPDIEIILYGSNNVTWIPCEVTQKGVLPSISDLAQLYRNADLGMVFSTTNPSLVPYEMMLCGCPVVDVDMEQAIMKYGNNSDNVFLFETEPERMAEQILEIIDDEVLLRKKALSGRKWVMDTFPTEEEMGRIVESFIKNKVRTGKMLLSPQD